MLAFIGFHLADLTWGTVADPDFVRGAVYDNLVRRLRAAVPVAIIYIVANLALGVHLFHGAWSMFQSLGVNNPRFNAARRYFAIGFAAVVIGINLTLPDRRPRRRRERPRRLTVQPRPAPSPATPASDPLEQP